MYIIMKDGLYLLGYQNTGIMEQDSTGIIVPVLTGIYSTKKRDAMLVENKYIANQLSGVAILVQEKEGAK